MARLAAPPACSSANLCFELAEAPLAQNLLQPSSHPHAREHVQPRSKHHHPAVPSSVFPGHFPAVAHPSSSASNHSAPIPAGTRNSQGRSPPGLVDQEQASPAQQLQQHLGGIRAPSSLREAVLLPSDPSLDQHGWSLAIRLGSMLQPQGDAHNDSTWVQRAVNIATSLPFALVGLHMLRQRQSPEGQRHAGTLVAVGAAATAYHASSGKLRPLARKLDYWTISYSAAEMIKALYPGSTWVRRAATASLLAVPFKPFVVSSLHAAVMEMEYIRQARQNQALRKDLVLHASTVAFGTAAFFLEDVVKDYGFDHMHGIWHCLAAYGLATMNGLLAHNERRHLAQHAKPRRRQLPQTHCSASSLADLQNYTGSTTRKGGK